MLFRSDDFHIRKYGFHGASHRFIAVRSGELMGRSDARVISCHLGGSSSLTAIDSGVSVMTTMGMTPQTGLPQNNRVGDFDPFGDFDLIFGAAKLNLKIVEVPIRYAAREYGETQISRFRHGVLLLQMVLFAYRKLKII